MSQKSGQENHLTKKICIIFFCVVFSLSLIKISISLLNTDPSLRETLSLDAGDTRLIQFESQMSSIHITGNEVGTYFFNTLPPFSKYESKELSYYKSIGFSSMESLSFYFNPYSSLVINYDTIPQTSLQFHILKGQGNYQNFIEQRSDNSEYSVVRSSLHDCVFNITDPDYYYLIWYNEFNITTANFHHIIQPRQYDVSGCQNNISGEFTMDLSGNFSCMILKNPLQVPIEVDYEISLGNDSLNWTLVGIICLIGISSSVMAVVILNNKRKAKFTSQNEKNIHYSNNLSQVSMIQRFDCPKCGALADEDMQNALLHGNIVFCKYCGTQLIK